MTLCTLHRISGLLIGTFVCLHVANHLVSLSSISSNIEFMMIARKFYRQPLIEAVLLICVTLQVISGSGFIFHGRSQRRGLVASLQAISGGYLAFFFLVHVGAVIVGRTVLALDTNFYFAAAGFHVQPFQYFFAPYYFFAVLALFTHLGCATYWKFQSSTRAVKITVMALPMLIGGTISLIIVLSLAGKIRPLDVPAQYNAIYERVISIDKALSQRTLKLLPNIANS
jgi:succinate dehydrogenase/fumarate reductase cytochrome b subunit